MVNQHQTVHVHDGQWYRKDQNSSEGKGTISQGVSLMLERGWAWNGHYEYPKNVTRASPWGPLTFVRQPSFLALSSIEEPLG